MPRGGGPVFDLFRLPVISSGLGVDELEQDESNNAVASRVIFALSLEHIRQFELREGRSIWHRFGDILKFLAAENPDLIRLAGTEGNIKDGGGQETVSYGQ